MRNSRPHLRCSRRDFLRMIPVVAAGAVANRGTALAQMMPGGGDRPSTIDPPQGEAFQDPTVLDLDRSAPGVAEGWISIAATTTAIAGRQASLLTYNGVFPGPTIEVKKGETLRLHVANDLPADGINRLGFARGATNIHTHGWHVSPTDPMDNSHRRIESGEAWTYEFDLRRLKLGTLGWYHPHVHGVVAEQLWAGLAGVLAVNDPNRSLDGYETHFVVLKDIDFEANEPAPYSSFDFMMGKEGDTVTVNGVVNPVLSIRPGQVQRWRIVNASTARFYKLSLDGHALCVIGVDGGLLDKPYVQSTVLLAPGERVDVLVKASDETGVYKLLSLPYTRVGMMMGGGGLNAQRVTLLTLNVSGTPTSDALPRYVRLRARRLAPNLPGLPHRTFTLGMMMGRATINGYDFDTQPYTITSRLPPTGPAFEVWTIRNPTGMDHPWHQHVNAAQVLSIQGGDAGYRAFHTTVPGWKDTVIVPRGGSLTQLVRLQNWRGDTMFHCHIVEHEDAGMMGEWMIE